MKYKMMKQEGAALLRPAAAAAVVTAAVFMMIMILVTPGVTAAESGGASNNGAPDISVNTLPIPPLLETSSPGLIIQEGSLTLPFGTSSTLGFNGDYLGPTIRVRNNDRIKISVQNTLGEDTTVHWHGLHVPAEYDGGPHQVIKAGTLWQPEFTVRQNAATLWYHPHLMGKTAEHVYRGLAGLFIIEDDYSDSLEIPRDYGINDIPLIIQDRRIDNTGQFSYAPFMPDLMHGYIGNVVLVNGAYQPELNISPGTYRFRIINGSNSSLMAYSFDDGRLFTVIASDGGFLPRSVYTDRLIMSPGERYEILVDFDPGDERTLLSTIYGGDRFETLKIRAEDEEGGRYFAHPPQFRYDKVEAPAGAVNRTFNMETRGMGRFTINGAMMDMNKINFTTNKNSTEIWTIRNVQTGMMNIPHSFHVHDVQFTVLRLNGKEPHSLYAGPKDTVLLMPGDEIVIALEFQEYEGKYMYHCHFLEHEDAGMMGQFLIK